MASATPAVRPTATSYQSLPTQALNPVQQTAQEIFATFSFFVTLPINVFDETSLIMQAYDSGSSTAFKVCCAVSSIFGSNALQEALQVAFLYDPRSFVPDHFERVQFLIEKGASPNLAPVLGHDNPAFAFLGSRSISQEQKIGFLEWLLRHGANPNFNQSSYPLFQAISDRNLAAVNSLLNHGANPNLPYNCQRSLIQFAFSSIDFNNTDEIKIIKRLIENGAASNLPPCLGDNPAFVFLSKKNMNQIQKIEFLKWLLEHRTDPNHNRSAEPLYRAIATKNREAIRILLEHGANPYLPCSFTFRRSVKDYTKARYPDIYAIFWDSVSEVDYKENYYAVIRQAALQLEKTTFEPNSVFEDLRQKIIDCRSAEALLGLKPSCSEQEAERAYRRLSKTIHPDKNGNSQASIDLFQCLNAARQSLTDPL